MGVMTEEQGVQALELALEGERAVVGAVPLEWPVLLGLMQGAVPSFLAAFATKATPQAVSPVYLPARSPVGRHCRALLALAEPRVCPFGVCLPHAALGVFEPRACEGVSASQ